GRPDQARGAAGRADPVDCRRREAAAPGAAEGEAQSHGGGVMAEPKLNRQDRRWRATSFPHFCRMAFAIWQRREQRPGPWTALVATAAALLDILEPRRPRHSKKRDESEAWLRR